MLKDLDQLMSARGIGAVIVPMHEQQHASFRWLTRGAKVTRGYAIKLAGREPILVSYPMERDEASATGLETRLAHDYAYDRLFREAKNSAAGYAHFYDAILTDLGAGGSIAFFGNLPFQLYHGVAAELEARGRSVYRSDGEDLIQLARKRKDAWEIDAIRSVGERTELVIDRVREVLRAATIDGDRVMHDGRALTLGDLKQLVSFEIARHGMIEDHDTILSQGRDAGIPHSRGDASALVRPSVPIVLDIFPLDRNSGYFFDETRTFCIGPIPDELRTIHGHVLEAFERARDAMRAGNPASLYQALVCDLFEHRGYETTRRTPATLSGYVHSLGHGVGLEIHEKPSFSLSPANSDVIEAGDVLTIEPGLYFPDRAIGVRIEETFVVRDDGTVESLCRSSRALEP
ncbi:MAG: Xaa-Pro aminopeptidase [Acidobacteriota bacterium]|jgi:Xaa-Pro aminopeptidase|nr:Xaa-Pro aminopeptidase [Acidobacteriota bacterium]